jgi:hypothetical protein
MTFIIKAKLLAFKHIAQKTIALMRFLKDLRLDLKEL